MSHREAIKSRLGLFWKTEELSGKARRKLE